MDDDKIQLLEDRIKEFALDRRRLIDIPFLIFRYPFHLELEYIFEIEKLSRRIKTNNGISSEVLRLNNLFIQSLEEIDTIDNLAQFERMNRKLLLQDLSNIERGLPKKIIEKIINNVKDKDLTYCLFIVRFSALFPFIRLPSFLTLLEGKVKCIIVILHPITSIEQYDDTKQAFKYLRGEEI